MSDDVLIYYNRRSGRGRAGRIVSSLAHGLHARGVPSTSRNIDDGVPNDNELGRFRTVIVVGGDGTVASIAEAAARNALGVYHYPMGTENLFAREFAMTAKPDDAIDRVIANRTSPCDTMRVHIGERTTTALLMMSVGPDAGVIHRLARNRKGPITHATYLPHAMAEILRPTLSPVTIDVDGARLCEGVTGMGLVANSRLYGGGFNPAHRAKIDDGMLDVTFHPATTGTGWLLNMLMCRLGFPERVPGLLHARGRSIKIHVAPGGCVQADGEALPSAAGPFEVRVDACEHALRVV